MIVICYVEMIILLFIQRFAEKKKKREKSETVSENNRPKHRNSETSKMLHLLLGETSSAALPCTFFRTFADRKAS